MLVNKATHGDVVGRAEAPVWVQNEIGYDLYSSQKCFKQLHNTTPAKRNYQKKALFNSQIIYVCLYICIYIWHAYVCISKLNKKLSNVLRSKEVHAKQI